MLITALATPFKKGKIDVYCYEKAVFRQVESGVDALLALGTTAEALLLDECEKKLLVRLTKGVAPQLPLWVGIEDSDTRKAVKSAETAEKLGADVLLVAPPAFVKCTPLGYVKHIRAIIAATSLPVAIYDAPTRCGYNLNAKAVEKLLPEIKYIKDADKQMRLTKLFGKSASVLCGNDENLFAALNNGAVGAVSVVSNVAPQLTKKALDGDEIAREKFNTLSRLAMAEINPVAIKYMLYKKGVFTDCDVRLPLTKASAKTRKLIDVNWEQIQ